MGLLGIFALAVAVTFTVVSGQNQQTIKQRAQEASSYNLRGAIYFDANGNFRMDNGEKYAVATVTLSGSDVNQEITTDTGGGYLFVSLKPGEYKLSLTKKPNGYSTLDGVLEKDITLNQDEIINFGLFRQSSLNVYFTPTPNSSDLSSLPDCGSGRTGCGILAEGDSCTANKSACLAEKNFTDSLSLPGNASTINDKWVKCCDPVNSQSSSPTPTPTPFPSCKAKGGTCEIGSASCQPPRIMDDRTDCVLDPKNSPGLIPGSICCALKQASTPTPTPKPTAAPIAATVCSAPQAVQNVKITIDGKTCP